MNQKTLTLAAIFAGTFFVIALVFAVIFGVKLSSANKDKTKAVSDALSEQSADLTADFQAQLEEITTQYVADEVFGSFSFSYPKVWSTNIAQSVGSSEELVFLADPNLIVFNEDEDGPYTELRVIVYEDDYESKLADTESDNKRASNKKTESDIAISGISGKLFVGNDVKSGKTIGFVILPLRDKTLYIGTDDYTSYSANFGTILDSFSISK